MSVATEPESQNCPLCELPVRDRRGNARDGYWFNCERCGQFGFGGLFLAKWKSGLRREWASRIHLLQGHLRERTEVSDQESGPPLRIDCEEAITAILEQVPQSIPDRAAKLLSAWIRRTEYFGHEIELAPKTDTPLAYARNGMEFRALLDFLASQSLVESSRGNYGGTVTARGFEYERQRRQSNAKSEKVFVAMRFSAELNKVYEDAIAPALVECGYDPKRVDLEEHNDDVIDRMFALIRESRFVVADFTEHRNGVYFEAGFARGLGLDVIWCCKADDMTGAHFDTSHFNHVTWKDAAELKRKLKLRIRATTGLGPLKSTIVE